MERKIEQVIDNTKYVLKYDDSRVIQLHVKRVWEGIDVRKVIIVDFACNGMRGDPGCYVFITVMVDDEYGNKRDLHMYLPMNTEMISTLAAADEKNLACAAKQFLKELRQYVATMADVYLTI